MVVFLVSCSMEKILQTLAKSKDLTQKELILKTRLSERTIRDSLKALVELGLVSQALDSKDLRYNIYKLNRSDKNDTS